MAEIEASAIVDLSMRKPRSHRFALIDALRFVAAFSVMCFHFTARGEPYWGRPVWDEFQFIHRFTAYGALGVELFFAISGFVILMSAWGRTLPQYVASRIGRLFPAYWFGVLLSAAVIVLLVRPAKGDPSVGQILLNLTMVQRAFGAPDVDGAYWTLYSELRFYLLIGIFILVGFTAKRVMAFCALWPLIAAIALSTHSGFLTQLLISDRAGLFAGGMMVYVLYREGNSLIGWLILIEDAVMGAYMTIVHTALPGTSKHTHVYLLPSVYYLAIFAFFAILVLITQTRLRTIEWKWLTTLGLLTYPVYLIHEHVGWWLISELGPHMSKYAALLLTMLVIVAAAWLIQRFVERPLGPRLRRSIEKTLSSLRDEREKEPPRG